MRIVFQKGWKNAKYATSNAPFITLYHPYNFSYIRYKINTLRLRAFITL